jgi:hypothetical protein
MAELAVGRSLGDVLGRYSRLDGAAVRFLDGDRFPAPMLAAVST